MSVISVMMSRIISHAICQPFLRWPFLDLEHPENYGMKGTANIRIPTGQPNEEIGAWFARPNLSDRDGIEQDLMPGPTDVVVIYLHGNTQTRSQNHRKLLYQELQKLGYFVLAIDYCGFADSSSTRPTESSMASDGLAAFEWVVQNSRPGTKIFLWGHSLGTGVASRMAAMIEQNAGQQPRGIILEAPFNRMTDEVESFTLARIFISLGLNIEERLTEADMSFESATWLRSVRSAILILHAEDDSIISHKLGRKLANDIDDGSKDVQFHLFPAEKRLGHTDIYLSEDLPAIISNFVDHH